ncbi:MAG: sugar ABC transporter ATP-binding protein [Eubacteriales bacterium]|nr:sugar ABC transporter ATP-binding protein [Eubacteriales bacterium]
MDACLQVKNISKTFPGVKALSDVSIDFFPGEAHALVGENGAGKSTLIKIIASVYTATEGKVYLDGKECAFRSPREAIDAGISVIQQELSIAPDLTVAQNIFLGCEPRKGICLDYKRMEQDAQKVLDDMELNIDVKAYCRDLTAAEQQMVEIAKVVSKNSKVVILDEPTSSLSEKEIESLFVQVRRMKANGVAVIYVTHRMKELFEICDRVTIFRDGCKMKEMMIADTDEKEIVANMIGRSNLTDYYNRHEHPIGEEVFRVENFSKGSVFKNINFHLNKGEILGFYGLVGAGRTETMEAIFGAASHDSGKMYLHGEEIVFHKPSDAIRKKIGFVTEDRRRTGLLLEKPIYENVGLPSLPAHGKRGLVNTQWEKEVSKEYKEKLAIKAPDISTITANLSGGNQQKVILAKWLAANSEIMILDEPTRGIDVNAKSEFYALMYQFVENGGSIIMISSEMPEIIGISDRVYVMREGEISGELFSNELSEQALIFSASITSDS